MTAHDDKSGRLCSGTKAENLAFAKEYLRETRIPEFLGFTTGEWETASEHIIARIVRGLDGPLAVRSSARGEDSADGSLAGRFRSHLHVPLEAATIRRAVDDVIASYGESGEPDQGHQVLIQEMVTDVEASGVIMTRRLDTGAPYYVISYDDSSGRTDSITGGADVHKTLSVHRDIAEPYIESPRIRAMLRIAREVEGVFGNIPLDIEFAVDRALQGRLLQVRRIAAGGDWSDAVAHDIDRALPILKAGVAHALGRLDNAPGEGSVLTSMSDWNPAEMIGAAPSPLAVSLYRELITDTVWAEARADMGYRPVPGQPLMMIVAGRPFIDTRLSLASFLPAGLGAGLEDRLVSASIRRLARNPQFHDKLEFEVALTAATPAFNERFDAIYDGLDRNDRETFRRAHEKLTARCLDLSNDGALFRSEQRITELEARQLLRPVPLRANERDRTDGRAILRRLLALQAECVSFGTRPFSILARHGFIAEAILRGMVERGALSPERAWRIRRGVNSIASNISEAMAAADATEKGRDAFFARYGFLRPSSYDILSPRYIDRPDLFTPGANRLLAETDAPASAPFVPTATETRSISKLMDEMGAASGGDEGCGLFLHYFRRATRGREWGKLVFTRNLSDILETVAAWGEGIGLERSELAHLTLSDMRNAAIDVSPWASLASLGELAAERKRDWERSRAIPLPYIIRHQGDISVVPMHRAAPNFMTRKTVRAPVRALTARDRDVTAVSGRIVCIESADPGFDWIFGKGIVGLVTQYGGPNSHMAIRCAEFGLPGAIGVGELMFRSILSAREIALKCGEHAIEVIR